jgi:6-pyruvoyltetrahydropterin/6-carboxytetrahydropterin synthase
MYELMVEESFDAAHALRGYEGPCENLHGHTWKVQVFLRGNKLNRLGLLEDFKIVRQNLRSVLKEFDHKLLNDLKPFIQENPTSENLARIIFKKLKQKQKNLIKVIVWESPATYAAFF